MSDILHPIREWLSKLTDPPLGTEFRWLEFDIKEMFPELHRDYLLPALCWIHEQVLQKRKNRGALRFFISKDGNRKLDNCSRGARDAFHAFTFSDVVHYVLFETFVGDCFLNLSSVISQNTGIPIGGSCLAQLASLVLIYREKSQDLQSSLKCGRWLRYRDNFLFLRAMPLDSAEANRVLEATRTDLEQLTGMDITVEQDSCTPRFLECMLSDPLGDHPLSLPVFLCCISDSTPPQVEKLMDPTAPGCASMLRSLVPSWVKKAAHYRLSRFTAERNLEFLQQLLTRKAYPTSTWKPLLRKGARAWGLNPPQSHA